MTEPIKVLFVDDEPMVLRSIERLLRARRIPWQSRFVGSAQEALEALGEQPFDVIVSDLRMPNLDGTALLRRAREQFPQVARLVLSGQAATREGVVAMQVAHQCLSKPYDLAVLRAAVERLARARRCLESPSLVAVVCRFSSLPSPPSTYQKLLAALEAGTPMREVEETLERDPALSAKILQLQRSAVLSACAECRSVSEVLQRVDRELAAVFALGEEMCRPMRDGAALPGDVETWQRNSVLVARVCQAVAPPALRGQAFSAGILHDIGSLIAASAPAELRPQLSQHATVGACLLDLWGIEEEVVDAVAHHRGVATGCDAAERDRSPLIAALCLAEYVVAEAGYSPQLHTLVPGIESAQLDRAREVLRRIGAEN